MLEHFLSVMDPVKEISLLKNLVVVLCLVSFKLAERDVTLVVVQ